jgi:hypothetical protein
VLKLNPMATVPRDRPVLLLTKTGIVSAWFAPGEWTEHYEYGREYNGPVWVCNDDQFQIEVEEISQDPADDDHNGCLGWYDPKDIEFPIDYKWPSKNGYTSVYSDF